MILMLNQILNFMKKSIIRAGFMLTGILLLSTSILAQEEKKQENVCNDKQEKACCNKKKDATCEANKDAKTASFKVYGNCGMCEDRIEKAATSVEGVCSSEWDKETKMIKFTYHPEKVKVEKIHEAIALVGHDTEKATASDEVYASLPGCCKYERR